MIFGTGITNHTFYGIIVVITSATVVTLTINGSVFAVVTSVSVTTAATSATYTRNSADNAERSEVRTTVTVVPVVVSASTGATT